MSEQVAVFPDAKCRRCGCYLPGRAVLMAGKIYCEQCAILESMKAVEDPYRYFDGATFKEDDHCKHCGCKLNGEAALVNGEEWCHPCADEADATDQAHQLDEDAAAAGAAGSRDG